MDLVIVKFGIPNQLLPNPVWAGSKADLVPDVLPSVASPAHYFSTDADNLSEA